MKRGTCQTCSFYHTVHHQCRYDPPTIMRIDGQFRSRWPNVDADDWCSHWSSAIVGGKRKSYSHQLNDGDVIAGA